MKNLGKYILRVICCVIIVYFILQALGIDITSYIGTGFNTPIETIDIVIPTNTVEQTAEITNEEIKALVASIRVSSESQTEKYNRDDWEKPTKSFKLNGKNLTRNKYSIYTSKWLISEEPFEYLCPYTGQTITDITKIDFDHIYPIHAVFLYLDIDWTNEQKNAFAYDLSIGVPVLNSANRSKGDKMPSEWLPSYRVEDYCYTIIEIASRYGIAMRQVDIDVCIWEIEKGLSNGETLELLTQYND